MNNNLGNRDTMAKNIKRYMNMYGYSSKELAERVGVSQATFSYWLQGKYYPRIDRIEKLAQIFHVTKADLVEEPNNTANDLKLLMREDFDRVISDDEWQLIKDYRNATEDVQRAARVMLADAAETNVRDCSVETSVS